MTNQLTKTHRRRRTLLRGAFGVLVASGALALSGDIVGASPLPAHHGSPQNVELIGLRQGAQGASVKSVQQALIAAGVNVPGGADGQFGPATRQAVVEFQGRKGLSPTGEVDEATAVALGLAAAPPSGGTGDSVDAFNGLQQGASGDAVLDLQKKLIKAGVWVPGGADGRFGNGTKTAVQNYQRWNGLKVSGVVDAAMASRLSLAGTSGASTSPATTTPEPTTTPATTAPETTSATSFIGLSVGAKGELVKQLQSALIAAGITVPGGADGLFGNATKTALANYQRANGLGVSGAVYPATATKLGLGASSPASPPAAVTSTTTSSKYVGLRVGSQGSLVKELQSALIAAGVTVRGGADGSFGNATKAALVSYQQANGLGSGGTVDAATAAKLALGQAAPQPATPTASVADDGFVGLAVGSNGPNVKTLQDALLELGLVIRDGGANGTFGPGTKTAVQAVQQVNGLAKTGVVTESVAKLLGLIGVTGNGPTAEGYPKKGQSNEQVRVLQQLLIDWKIDVRGGADGSFGNATTAAITKFQQVHGLQVTGTVTQETAKKMGLPAAGAPPPVGAIKMERFPIQGQCYYGNTWHAPRGNGRLHIGVDLIANEGNLLYAVVDGTITKQYWDTPGALSGNGLRVAEDNGTYFTYLHMLGFAPGIKVGTKVKAGDVIGWVGNTGSSATAHLHFEIHPGGGPAVNPYPYIKAMDECSNTTPQYQSSFAE